MVAMGILKSNNEILAALSSSAVGSASARVRLGVLHWKAKWHKRPIKWREIFAFHNHGHCLRNVIGAAGDVASKPGRGAQRRPEQTRLALNAYNALLPAEALGVC